MKHVKEKANTFSPWGDIPEERSVEKALRRSLIIVDKPAGPTSHQLSSWVQLLFGMKAGHSGTLDPGVTGVLPFGLGYSVRLVDLLHAAPKEYIAAMRFHGPVKKKSVEKLVQEFTGEIYQMPPVRSGVKRQRRVREIYELEILDFKRQDYLFRVLCQSGTYIRTLCRDMGKCISRGGHMMELRRSSAGGFLEEDSESLTTVRDAWERYKAGDDSFISKMLLPYERALELYPKVVIKDTAAGALLEGADLAAPGIYEMEEFSVGDSVSVMSAKGEGIAFGVALKDAADIVSQEEGLVVRTERVFHPSGEYPRSWK